MPTGLIFSGEGFDTFAMVLERYQHQADDLTPVWDKIADRFTELQGRNFDSEGATMSGGWTPLSPDYGKWKATHHPGKKILDLGGDLRESLAGKLGVRELTRKSMTVGTQIPYASYHQNGTSKMPARRLIGDVPVPEQQEWAKVLQRHLFEGASL